jgi:KaiC/GvpD/RAD55 family RecA-like ATPase
MMNMTAPTPRTEDEYPFDPRLKKFLPQKGWLSREALISSLQLAFQQRPVVLLYGENGGGKTTSSAMFALHEVSRGVLGGHPVLYSSFQETQNLTDLLESFGQVYEIALLERNLDWRTLDDIQRAKLVQDLLKKVPLLWVWDDFELVGMQRLGQWTEHEKQQLVELLRTLPKDSARILIISNSTELSSLGDIPERVQIDLEVANPLAQEIASRLTRVDLQAETQLSSVLQQALTQFVEKPFAGKEQKIILLMGLFRGIVSLEIIRGMAHEGNRWRLEDLAGLDTQYAKMVFDRAAEYRLCTPIASTGYYLIEPAVRAWLARQVNPKELRTMQRAFTQSMAGFARQTVNAVQAGNNPMIDLLAAHESNLRQSLAFADRFGWRGVVIDLLSALRPVFLKSRRFASWNRQLDQLSRHFIHPDTLQPASRKDRFIRDFLDYQVEISLKRDHFTQAARWQSILVLAERDQKAGCENTRDGEIGTALKSRDLARSLAGLGEIYRQTASPKSIESYQEAFQIAQETGDTRLAGDIAARISEAYLAIPVARNFEHAETWIQTGLEIAEVQAGTHSERLTSQLIALRGKAAYELFLKAQKASQPVQEQVSLLNQALDNYFQALDLVSEDDHAAAGKLHEMIGLLYLQSEGMLETAVEFYNLAIDEMDRAGTRTGAAHARFKLAVSLFLLNDFERSRQYGQAALQTYEELGIETVIEAQKVRKFLSRFNS